MRLVALLVLLPALSLSARQNQFVELPSFPKDLNPRSTVGNYEVLVHVDGEAFLYVEETRLKYLPLSGAPIRDAGTNYTQSLPRTELLSFRLLKKAGRGDVTLQEPPSRQNNFTAVIRVNDRAAGEDFYHIHLDWTWAPPGAPVSNNGGGRPEPPRNNNNNPFGGNNNNPFGNQGRSGSFEYRGNVEDSSVISIRGNQVREEDLDRRTVRGNRLNLSQPVPQEYLRTFDLVDVSGRGEVELVERPWEGNDYTAVVRIVDPARGSAPYAFRLVWQR